MGSAERHIDSAFNLVSAQLSSKAGADEKAMPSLSPSP